MGQAWRMLKTERRRKGEICEAAQLRPGRNLLTKYEGTELDTYTLLHFKSLGEDKTGKRGKRY